MEDARRAVADLLRLDPDYRIRKHVAMFAPYREKAHNDVLWDSLRKAGLPD
jgi:hypothetical protein